ncbi:MAG: hypothetical protein LCH91_16595 [Bacteroidetes bacterium]|nr:hypothetical protein [Bacteroidota bacterium]
MKSLINRFFFFVLVLVSFGKLTAQSPVAPEKINFVRQGVRRFIFDETQQLPLAALYPREIIGLSAMYPVRHALPTPAQVSVLSQQLSIQSTSKTQTSIWFGGFNPFATYMIDLARCQGQGEMGFEFTDASQSEQLVITFVFKDEQLLDVRQKTVKNAQVVAETSIATKNSKNTQIKGKIILQMLGSGLTLFLQNDGLPLPIGQFDFGQILDLRHKKYLHSFQSRLYVGLQGGEVLIKKVESVLSSGMGLADIRAITYEDGSPLLDKGRLWYTMTIRGRALPHHVQGVFSLDPTTFDLRLEGVIVFDRNDGLLRNEVASHLFYDRKEKSWRGLTTGFSAYAKPEEKKQLLAIESQRDPRFGFSVMKATPFGLVGDIEDPHVVFDSTARKWRMLTCENQNGYKAIMLESEAWNKGYRRIAGPVQHNSTGTSIQKIGNERYCFSGSQERQVFIYSYPTLQKIGTLKMDLPPWDTTSGTRVWPNVVELPEGYPFRYVALMMDRFNFPGLEGPNWTYGALYLYHGYESE